MMTAVLKLFERMKDPTEVSEQNFTNQVTKEIEKFQSDHNCMALRQHFEKKFEGQPQKLTNLLSQGVFTHQFLSTLLFSIPSVEQIKISQNIKTLSGPLEEIDILQHMV